MGPEALKTLSGTGTLGAVMAPILGLLGLVIGVLVARALEWSSREMEPSFSRPAALRTLSSSGTTA